MNENLDPAKHIDEQSEVNKQVPVVETNVDGDEMVNTGINVETADQAGEVAEIHTPAHQTLTKDEIIKKLELLLNQEEVPGRAEVDTLKHLFYKIKSSENDNLKQQFIADGGLEAEFVLEHDGLEESFKTLLNSIKEKRAKALAIEDSLKEENLQKKLRIIDSIKNLTESTDDFNKLYKEFKDLQQQWNEIKLVPASQVNDLWKAYQLHSEKFYDIIKINNEFRDYDFKKNLELKTTIIEAVEKLKEESDVVSAFHQLQNFHQQWREIGPVVKEIRDEIWEKFKLVSSDINKKHQAHFEGLKGQEEANLVEKTAICEILKTIDYSLLKSFKDWDEKSKEVIELQAKWKTIGFVPKKVNNQIFEEYRALCDTFFEKKADFFKKQRGDMDENLVKKKALVARAELLKDSTDWKATTDEMISIQKEWKKIGTVPRKYSDIIWKEFVTACDYFFEQKNKNVSSQKTEELENLEKKKAVILKINALSEEKESSLSMDSLRTLMDEWHGIGFVPFKEKDKIYKEYQSALDVQFERLKIDKSERRLQSFKSTMEDISKSERPKGRLFKERDKLVYQFNKVKADLQTYENNMGFLSISKNGGGLLKDMEHKIQDLKNELDLISQKIDSIDESLKEIE